VRRVIKSAEKRGIFDIAGALGIKTEAANPMHDAWRWKNVKKRTDK
jgi:hypothetical protein